MFGPFIERIVEREEDQVEHRLKGFMKQKLRAGTERTMTEFGGGASCIEKGGKKRIYRRCGYATRCSGRQTFRGKALVWAAAVV